MNPVHTTLVRHFREALKARIPQVEEVSLHDDEFGQYLTVQYWLPFYMEATGEVTRHLTAVSEHLRGQSDLVNAMELVTGFFNDNRRAYIAADDAEIRRAYGRAQEAGGYFHPDRFIEYAA